MARPREFDEAEVLERALCVFWAHGYEATSLADLTEATGLAKGSIYKAFQDKRSLYLAALDHYLERGQRMLETTLDSAESPQAGIERWLDGIGQMARRRGQRRGCFAVNATVELAPHDREVRDRLAKHQERLRNCYVRTIARGVELGEFRRDLDPAAAAEFLSTVVNGLQVSGKAGLTKARVDAQITVALAALLSEDARRREKMSNQ